MQWRLIESDEALQAVVEDARGRDVVAVDTEFMRRNTFYPQVALLQLCFEDVAWLIDPLAIEDTSFIADLLTDPTIVKVLHSGSEDLEVFQRWLGVLPVPLFDTQRAAAMLGRGFGLGYRALVEAVEGVDVPKGETRSDWLQRPLTESQCDYAALDVIHLLAVWRVLDEECRAQGKIDWVLGDGRDAVANQADNGSGYYRKIKSAWKLDAPQLGRLQAICDWRETVARQRDKPRSWIIDDKACLAIAIQEPSNKTELGQCELPAPAVRRYAEQLLDLLDAQGERGDGSFPPALGAPLSQGQRQTVKKLKAKVATIAQQQGTNAEILLSGKDFEMLVREAMGERAEPPVAWSGWRSDVVVTPLREMLAGDAS